MTQHRKLHNQVAFGTQAQIEDTQTGKGFGMLGITGAHKVRKESKGILKPQKLLQSQQQQSAKSFQNSGLVSTVAMTSNQGMQLINPSAIPQKQELF